jgi:hypothetical protein
VTTKAPPFYMTHLPQPYAVSTSVGSGKSRAAIRYISDPANGAMNFLYVAPSIKLLNQTRTNILKEQERVKSPRNVHMIHSESRADDTVSTAQTCLDSINAVEGNMGRVVLLTTQTFLNIVARIELPGYWGLILDEAFAPLDFLECHLGDDLAADAAYFMETLDVDPTDNHRVVPRAGKRGKLELIAEQKWRKVGSRMRGMEPFARAVLNPALRCELVLTDKVRAMLDGVSTPVGVEERDGESGSTLTVASFVTPDYFMQFREVVFMSALFEHTILYALWRKVYGVEFQQHPQIQANITRDVHKEQGPMISVGHLLHPNDNASKHNLSRNRHTGASGETAEGERIIDHAVENVDKFFGGRTYLLSVNNGYGYDSGSPLMVKYPAAVRIPVLSHGLNEYENVDNVAALAVVNPIPQYAKWIEERTGMTRSETYRAHRIHATYQAVGRTSVRNSSRAKKPKTFIALGCEDAAMLHTFFEGSRWLGHIGDIPDLKELRGVSTNQPSALTLDIVAYLQNLDPKVKTISSRELKSRVSPETASATWGRAARAVSSYSKEWKKVGQSLVRKVDHYGFTPEVVDPAEVAEAVA